MKKTSRSLFSLLATVLSVSALAGCSNDKWKFSEDDLNSMIELDGEISKTNQNNIFCFKIDETLPFFKTRNEFGDDDFVFFNYSKLYEECDPKDNLYTYKDFCNYKIDYQSITFKEDGTGFEVVYAGSEDQVVGAIFNKRASTYDCFIYVGPSAFYQDDLEESQAMSFEDNYFALPGPTFIDGTKKINVLDYYGSIMEMAESQRGQVNLGEDKPEPLPKKILKGILSFIPKIIMWLRSEADSVAVHQFDSLLDAFLKLDGKINAMSSEIKNAFVAIDEKLDVNEISRLETAIAGFTTNYENKITAHRNNFADYLKIELTNYVSTNQTVNVCYAKENGVLTYIPHDYVYTGETVNVAVSNIEFNNAKAFILTHSGMQDKVMDEIIKDINVAIENVTLPEGITKADFAKHVLAAIEETNIENIYSDASLLEECQNLRNEILDYCRAMPTLLSDMSKRFNLLYSFAGDALKAVSKTFATVLFNLDLNVAFAQTVLKAANIDELGLSETYKTVRENVVNIFNVYKKYNSNFGLGLGVDVNSKFTAFQVSANITGVRKEQKANPYLCYLNYHLDGNVIQETSLNYGEETLLDTKIIKKFSLRYNALKSQQFIDDITFFEYLKRNNVIDKTAISWKNYHESKTKTKSNRIIAGDVSTKAIETGKKLVCWWDVGNCHGPYFKPGEIVGYREKEGAQYWNKGFAYIADTYDLDKGQQSIQTEIGAYAEYYYARKAWRNPEFFLFRNPSEYEPGFVLLPAVKK